MNTITIAPFVNAVHRSQVVALWETVFGYEAAHNSPSLVIDKKVAVDDQLFFVAIAGNAVVGTIMTGYDGHRGWIYSVAVSPAHRRLGIGSRLVSHAEHALTCKGCMKINLQIMEGNESVAGFTHRLVTPWRNALAWVNESWKMCRNSPLTRKWVLRRLGAAGTHATR